MRERILQRAIDAMGQRSGNLSTLADRLKISSQALSQWRRVPAARVLDVERITGIPRHDLRPDLYPRETSPRPANSSARDAAA